MSENEPQVCYSIDVENWIPKNHAMPSVKTRANVKEERQMGTRDLNRILTKFRERIRCTLTEVQ